MASEKPKPVPIEVLAKRLHDKYCAELAAGRRGTGKPLGRPLDGVEPKMHMNVRLEPATVLELHVLTGGKSASELLVALCGILRMARSATEDAIVLKALVSVLAAGGKAEAA